VIDNGVQWLGMAVWNTRSVIGRFMGSSIMVVWSGGTHCSAIHFARPAGNRLGMESILGDLMGTFTHASAKPVVLE
jgi:hypothetical protein